MPIRKEDLEHDGFLYELMAREEFPGTLDEFRLIMRARARRAAEADAARAARGPIPEEEVPF